MSKICQITGKRPLVGNNRSHAMNAVKKKFLPNLHYRKLWVQSKNKFIKVKISTKALRMIDKKGIDFFLLKILKKK